MIKEHCGQAMELVTTGDLDVLKAGSRVY